MLHALPLAAMLAFQPATDPSKAAEPPESLVQTERLMASIRALPVRRCALGGEEDLKGLARTEALIVSGLKELGYEPTIHTFSWAPPARPDDAKPGPGATPGVKPEPREWHNVIVDLPGTDKAAEVVIVGAHFDAVMDAPGADDNGTGVAALLEMARVYKGRPTHRTIRLAFFNLEEEGLVGSTAYADSLGEKIDQKQVTITGMIALDMLGYFSDKPGSQRSPIKPIPGVFEPPTVGDSIGMGTILGNRDFARGLAKYMKDASPGLKVEVVDFMPIPVPDMMRSDHAAFMAMGVPALLLTDTANFRNPNYHRPTDTIETIDQARYTEVVRGLAGAVYRLTEPVGPAAADGK
jgi:aminopeptidase YwaD